MYMIYKTRDSYPVIIRSRWFQTKPFLVAKMTEHFNTSQMSAKDNPWNKLNRVEYSWDECI